MSFCKPSVVISKCLTINECPNSKFYKVYNQDKGYINFISYCPIENIKMKGDINKCKFNFLSNNVFNELKLSDRLLKNEGVVGVIYKKDSSICGKLRDYYNNEIASAFDDDLLNYKEKDSFYNKLFCLSKFKEIKQKQDFEELKQFNNKNSYLLKLYNNDLYSKLEELINFESKNIFDEYESALFKLFNSNKSLNKEKYLELYKEIISHFKDYINLKEIEFLKECCEDYENDLIDEKHIEYLLKNNLLRFNIDSIYEQTLFNRYPKDLLKNIFFK